jgi:hypothetical protein
MRAEADGSFTLVQHLNTSATILGASDLPVGNTEVPAIYTTAGLMKAQPDGSFSAPTGLTYPTDAVPGAYVLDNFVSGHNPNDIAVERFTPNAGDLTHGTIRIGVFPMKDDGTLGAEVESTVATNVAAPSGSARIVAGNFDGITDADDLYIAGTIMIGHSDYTFTASPKSLGFSTGEQSATAYRTSFGGLGYVSHPDSLLLFPAPATAADPNSDAVQPLLNQEDGTFARMPRVDMSAGGTTSGPLLTYDFTDDNNQDLTTAVVTGAGSPAVAIAAGLGRATFFKPVLVPLPGLVAVEEFNTAIPGIICLTATGSGGSRAYFLATLPDKSVQGRITRLSVSPNPATAGEPVTLVATVSSPSSQLNLGSVTFFDGAVTVGQADLQDDLTAILTVPKLSAGVHTLTATPDGSAPATSFPISLTVNAAPAQPLISAQGLQFKLPNVLVPGDAGLVRLTFANLGGATASDSIRVSLFASPTVTLDSTSIPIPDSALDQVKISVGAGRSRTIATSLTVPEGLPAGTYYLIAAVSAGTGTKATEVIASTLIQSTPVQVAWQFGEVGNRHNVKLVQHLSNSDVVTFSLVGKGTGTVTQGGGALTLGTGNPNYEVSVDQTTFASRFAVAQHGETASNIMSLTLNTPVGIVDVRQDTPHLIEPGGGGATIVDVGQLLIGTMPAAQRVAGADPTTSIAADITITGSVDLLSAVAIDNGNVNLSTAGTGTPGPTGVTPGPVRVPQITIGTIVTGYALTSLAPIDVFRLGSAELDSAITAPSIGKLTCAGDFNAQLTLTGLVSSATVLGSIDIGGSIAGAAVGNDTWAINGNIGRIRIVHSAKNLQVLGGAKLGLNGQITEPPAAFSGVKILSIAVGGSIVSCEFFAGLDPVDGVLLNSDDKLLAGGSIGAIAVSGSVSADSRFEAASLPAFAIVGGTKIATSGEPRFKSA